MGGEKMDKSEKGILMEIHCPDCGEVLSMIRSFVCCVARGIGFCDEEIAKIEISVDEACANVVRHAYEKEKQKKGKSEQETQYKIKILIKAAEDHLQVIISDYGIGKKEGTQWGVRNLEEYLEQGHGLGTYIINEFMDKVEILYPKDAGTTVSMVKYLQR
jgi:serine/threonine-protein kinase RsbW